MELHGTISSRFTLSGYSYTRCPKLLILQTHMTSKLCFFVFGFVFGCGVISQLQTGSQHALINNYRTMSTTSATMHVGSTSSAAVGGTTITRATMDGPTSVNGSTSGVRSARATEKDRQQTGARPTSALRKQESREAGNRSNSAVSFSFIMLQRQAARVSGVYLVRTKA